MLIQVRGEKKLIKVTSVILDRDIEDEQDLKVSMFFCYNCQNPIAQYKGSVINIMPGMVPNPYPVLQLCKNCKKIYSFAGVAYI